METIITKENGRKLVFEPARLERYVGGLFEGTNIGDYQKEVFIKQLVRFVSSKEEYPAESITKKIIMSALENVELEDRDWDIVARNGKLKDLYKKASKNRMYDAEFKYGSLFALIKELATIGVYSKDLLAKYSKEEINEIGKMIDPQKDKLFTFAGLNLLSDRYLATDYEKNVMELPQERFVIIAMQLMLNEKEYRMELVKEAYWALSNLYMTTATPTLSNSGKSYGQFSSCFIDTVDDSLRGIFDNNTDIATLSKAGGGIGVYLTKIRSLGAAIKGFKGASSGITNWAKQLNNTAVSVDQLGTRSGAVSIYLDVWHKDIFDFLDGKLNNGDERRKFHDLFTGAVIPDLFMEQVEKRGSWYLFDPHEVKEVMGFALEDFYDEKKGQGSFREKFDECIKNPNLSKKKIDAIDIMKRIMKSQLETGTPYMFYKDEVNRKNPNKHEGIIYCSNLCSEIAQNTSPTVVKKEILTDDGTIIIEKQSGDFVVCNLSSVVLGRAVTDGVLERLINIQVRMLDNVIDLNEDRIEVKQAVHTNRKYRAVGLGTQDLHHLLALKGLKWESQEAVDFQDKLYEDIAYYTIKASMKLAIEKGAYPLFKGSDWHTGQYFEIRGYESDRWKSLANQVRFHGVRNGYLMAIAPTGSTSVLSGSTASTDPIFKQFYTEEKKGFKIPIVVPSLSAQTTWFYKSAYHIDQHWSIKANAVRQKHIDQAISFNLYVSAGIKATELLDLHLDAWKSGLKTSYYVRSTSQKEIEECEYCSA